MARELPRSEEHLIREYVKFKVGRLVYASVSPDEEMLGFGFPAQQRAALVAADPDRFCLPRASDLRYNWINARLAALGTGELTELLTDAWCMCVPKRLAAEHLRQRGLPQ